MRIIKFLCLWAFVFALGACSSDEEITNTPVTDSYLSQAKSILKDSIVFNAKAWQGTVNKTRLESGCPVKYHFSWKGDTMTLQIKAFSVGSMPLRIWFVVNCKFMQLNSWEKDEYTGDGWIKFEGSGGNTTYLALTTEYADGTGGSGTVTGYLNVLTKEIEFETNFNVMNFSTQVYQQKIDYSRMANFDAEFAQYEKDLAEYKKEHGL